MPGGVTNPTICHSSHGKLLSSSPWAVRAESAALFVRHLSSIHWKTVDSTRWTTTGSHINVLEAYALLAATRWLLSDPAAHLSHLFVCVDSLVALLAVAKGCFLLPLSRTFVAVCNFVAWMQTSSKSVAVTSVHHLDRSLSDYNLVLQR